MDHLEGSSLGKFNYSLAFSTLSKSRKKKNARRDLYYIGTTKDSHSTFCSSHSHFLSTGRIHWMYAITRKSMPFAFPRWFLSCSLVRIHMGFELSLNSVISWLEFCTSVCSGSRSGFSKICPGGKNKIPIRCNRRIETLNNFLRSYRNCLSLSLFTKKLRKLFAWIVRIFFFFKINSRSSGTKYFSIEIE